MTMRIVGERCVEVQKSPKRWIRIQLIKPGEEEHPGLDIREYIESDRYTGRTKKGVRIPEEMLPEIVSALKEVGALERKEGM